MDGRVISLLVFSLLSEIGKCGLVNWVSCEWVSGSTSPLHSHCLPEILTRLWGLSKRTPLPTQAVHTHYWLALQSCLFQLAAPVTAHLVSPGGSMKWKFMFKFKNNILTLGASDVYIFNNLLRMKAWMSMCVTSCLLPSSAHVFHMECVCMDVFTCAHEHLCVLGGNNISIFSGVL